METGETSPLKTIFVGGPGRSGTSFVAERLGRHAEVCSFPGVELKIFSEKNGLLDLRHALVERYSPNRAGVALDQFRKLFGALVGGQFGQPAFGTLAPPSAWFNILDGFCDRISAHGIPVQFEAVEFDDAVRTLLSRVASLAALIKESAASPVAFLEKTPHALLFVDFLARFAPAPQFVHVMRDPRSIAFSLRRMPWGPRDLEGCCAWVSGYCAAWLDSQKKAAQTGCALHRINIEAVAAAPDHASRLICDRLGLSFDDAVFAEADLKTLNAWVEKCAEVELLQIRRALDGWARHFGYDAAAIGFTEMPVPSSVPMFAEAVAEEIP
ncbi:MAG: sulfotransferase [Pseudomonadota bacterium]